MNVLNKSFNLDKARRYSYVIDLDERGIFKCHVENYMGKIIWQADNEENEDGIFWPVEDGFMKHTKDIKGLEKYLKDLNFLTKFAILE